MELKESRFYAVMSAMHYCATWNYPYIDLELTYDEFHDLLENTMGYYVASLAQNSNCIRAWGIDIKAKKYPRKSMMRACYLYNINSAAWIQELLWQVERYR